MIYGYLNKVIRRHTASKSNVAIVKGQKHVESASFYSTDGSVNVNDVEESIYTTSSLIKAHTDKLCKLEELIDNIVEKLDDISQRMDQAERKLKKHDALISKVIKRFDCYTFIDDAVTRASR